MSASFLDILLAAAEICGRKEESFRRESQARLEMLSAARVAAYRRYHLLKGMAEGAAACSSAEEGSAAALDFVLTETGWSEDDLAYSEVREQLGAVAHAVAAKPPEGDAAIRAFEVFEAWYRERFASDFLDLLERDRAFLPVVDF
jgi:hypothetical protein